MQMIYGYCRVSTKRQNIERQERNILTAYPNAKIFKEKFTGTKMQGRKELDKILRQVQSGDIIVFDSVSRMSRNAAEGIELYMRLMDKGIELVFLKEPHINTQTYKQALSNSVELVGNEIADIYIEATNKVLRLLATRQIELAFEQSEKEASDLRQRTREGIETARRNEKQIGTPQGAVLKVKKKAPALNIIRKHSQAFGGELNDTQCAAAARISRKTFYKYKQQLFIQELLREAPFLTIENYETVLPYKNDGANQKYYEDLQSCASFLRRKYGNDVNGLWFIRVPSVDGGVQIIIRTKEAFDHARSGLLAVDVFSFTCHEMEYVITNDSVDGLRSIPIDEWLANGEVFTIFDYKR